MKKYILPLIISICCFAPMFISEYIEDMTIVLVIIGTVLAVSAFLYITDSLSSPDYDGTDPRENHKPLD